jgi:hypothetical protein
MTGSSLQVSQDVGEDVVGANETGEEDGEDDEGAKVTGVPMVGDHVTGISVIVGDVAVGEDVTGISVVVGAAPVGANVTGTTVVVGDAGVVAVGVAGTSVPASSHMKQNSMWEMACPVGVLMLLWGTKACKL